MKRKRLGEVLRERGHVSPQELDKAVRDQQSKTILLGELLLERGAVRKVDLAASLEEITRIKYVDWESVTIDNEVVKLIPHSVAIRCGALPLFLENNQLVVLMSEPQNLRALDELRFISGKEILPCLGFRDEVKKGIEKHYGSPNEEAKEEPKAEQPAPPKIEFFTTSSRESNREALKEFEAEMRRQRTPAVALVSSIISAAAAKGASDIHIDPQATETLVRLRVDGMLLDFMQVPQPLQTSLISRIKILADMDIAERRAPQDGRLLVRVGNLNLDLRVATLPTHYGEKVVIRLLNTDASRLNFRQLGFSERVCDAFQKVLSLPQGMLLVTGPTGSGKSTTLYAALNQLRGRGLNIITVEDPIEYMLEGVNHVQVNAKAGRTFANCLRSLLRQDPNVIMVGEIRDSETAEIALTAAQTGHLLLSTLHTNDSVGAIMRLLDLNIPPFLIAYSVTAVIAQRLLRKLCVCRKAVAVPPDYAGRILSAGVTDYGDRTFVPSGCPLCEQTGYAGRVGVYEILFVDDAIRAAIRTGTSSHEIRTLARSAGTKLMQEEALENAKAGKTSLHEVFRVIPFEASSGTLCEACHRELIPTFLFCPYCGKGRHKVRRKKKDAMPIPVGTSPEESDI